MTDRAARQIESSRLHKARTHSFNSRPFAWTPVCFPRDPPPRFRCVPPLPLSSANLPAFSLSLSLQMLLEAKSIDSRLNYIRRRDRV
jgi:hypothetical protein